MFKFSKGQSVYIMSLATVGVVVGYDFKQWVVIEQTDHQDIYKGIGYNVKIGNKLYTYEEEDLEFDKWDLRFIELAELISTWSKDTTKVGAVIVSGKQILTTGYNGFPKGVEDSLERINDRETKLRLTVHAEMNAILQASQHGINITGSTIYIFGRMPCKECAKHIVASGIKQVVFKSNNTKASDEWVASLPLVKELFSEAGVACWEVGDE